MLLIHAFDFNFFAKGFSLGLAGGAGMQHFIHH